MRRRRSRVWVVGAVDRSSQPASTWEKSGWDRKDVAGVCSKTGKAGYLYYKKAAAAIAGAGLCSRENGQGAEWTRYTEGYGWWQESQSKHQPARLVSQQEGGFVD